MKYILNKLHSRFTATHSGSAMFDLTNPALRKKMVKAKIFWNRYQTKYDLKIFRICLELRKLQLVNHVFVDRNHFTNVVLVRGGPATPIYDLEVFPTMFNQDPRVLAVVSGQRYEPDDEDETLAVMVEEENPEQL